MLFRSWEAFADAIEEIFDYFDIADLTWVHSIPFPIPHTRPVGITVSGNQRSVIDKYSEWKPRTAVPGNIMHLLEHRLTRAGYPSTGFVLLVPHYLSDSEYPAAAVTAFEMQIGMVDRGRRRRRRLLVCRWKRSCRHRTA